MIQKSMRYFLRLSSAPPNFEMAERMAEVERRILAEAKRSGYTTLGKCRKTQKSKDESVGWCVVDVQRIKEKIDILVGQIARRRV